jgi:hypothetical protein
VSKVNRSPGPSVAIFVLAIRWTSRAIQRKHIGGLGFLGIDVGEGVGGAPSCR